jgi:hypothetical protein
MPRQKQTKGKCVYCGKEFAKSGISRHLKTCATRQQTISEEKGEQERLFHLQVQGTWRPEYWMHLEMPGSLTLEKLDTFLRDIWLECCGHLSAFTINGTRYEFSVDPTWDYWGEKPHTMKHKLSTVFYPGLKTAYEYDFGSTTSLDITVVAEREGVPNRAKPIHILSRNGPPDIPCENCGQQQATRIYTWEDYKELCDACGDASGFDNEGWLPVVNSPRAGECGYTGDAFVARG